MLFAAAGRLRTVYASELEIYRDIYHDLPRGEWIFWGAYFGCCIAGIIVGVKLQ